ncbi:MAG: hypothetical protein PWQ22_992 [Archaeoglobaceae archaeon]|nr:hypothetical protein [Archaeoglobaceae archaeon]
MDLKENDEEIAKKISDFLEVAPKQEKSYVPTWSEVAERYVSELYI